jgi:RecA/RadA recombinase
MDITKYLSTVEKQFGKKNKESTVEFKYASQEKPPTGLIVDNPQLEYILDRRFMAFGRFYLAYGEKGSSKTSLFYDFAKMFQKNNGLVIWLETENAADKDYAAKQGVDLDKLVLQHPPSLEDALTLAETYIRNLPKEDPEGTTPILICLDSIAGSTTDYELDTSHDIRDMTPGSHARILSRFYREIEHPLSTEKIVFLAINQLKEKIGAFGWSAESKESMIGGNAPLFSSTYQFKMDKISELMGPDENGVERKVGSVHKIQARRNKLGREGKGQDAEVDLYIEGGMDWYSPLVRRLVKHYPHILERRGGTCVWQTPNVRTTDDDGNEIILSTDQNYRDGEMARMISRSPEMKEVVRNAFKIPVLPTAQEVAEVEAERQTKRKKRAKSLSDEPMGVIAKPVD